MPKKKKTRSSSRKILFKRKQDWTTLYAYKDRAQAVRAKKQVEGTKQGGYVIKARVKRLPNGNWACQTSFGKEKATHYGTKRMHE